MEGLKLPVGSVQEKFALRAFKERQYTRYVEVLLVVNAILEAANRISAANTDGQPSSSNNLKELLNTYKELLMPEYAEERDAEVKKVQKIMERESKIGSFKVEPMVYGKRKKKGLN